MGFDPDTGDELLPVTKNIVDEWKDQIAKTRAETTRQAPQSVNLDNYEPFDPISGQPRVWYSRDEKGDYQFYDNPGFDPHTGLPLSIITRDVVDGWQSSRREKAVEKCYVITRDAKSPVQYRNGIAGIDPITGRQF